MADAYFEIDEYLWFIEYQQGNVNVAGLVFDDLIEETINLGPEDVLTVYSDVLEDALCFTEAFTPYHYAAVSDNIFFQELYGVPLRVKQSVLNVAYTTPIQPIKIAHMHIDVLHGSDTYWEEVSSELQIHSSYANAVPYYWEWIFESLGIDMTEPQPLPPIYLRLYLSNNDLVNMRHDVEQEYLFNSKCFEEFFIWDTIVWGWDHKVAESLVSTDTMQEIIGKVADDYLYLGDAEALLLKVLHVVDDRVFIFDAGTHEKYYLLTAADTIDFGDVLQEIFGHLVYEALFFNGLPVSGLIRYCSADDAVHVEDDSVSERYYLCLADEIVEMADDGVTFLSLNKSVAETFNAGATAVVMGTFVALASESLTFTDIDSYIHGLIIEEGLAFGDVELTKWVVNVLIESGCNVSDIIA